MIHGNCISPGSPSCFFQGRVLLGRRKKNVFGYMAMFVFQVIMYSSYLSIAATCLIWAAVESHVGPGIAVPGTHDRKSCSCFESLRGRKLVKTGLMGSKRKQR